MRIEEEFEAVVNYENILTSIDISKCALLVLVIKYWLSPLINIAEMKATVKHITVIIKMNNESVSVSSWQHLRLS